MTTARVHQLIAMETVQEPLSSSKVAAASEETRESNPPVVMDVQTLAHAIMQHLPSLMMGAAHL